jgi:transcriptional regulator with XRE-family HTH domain
VLVPRTKPIPKKDREIAARLKEFREMWKCSRPQLAAHIGVEPAVIVRIEAGRVPLKYGVARKIFSYLPINPYWAATGKGLCKGYVVLPEEKDLNLPPNSIFSDVFFSILSPSLQNENKDFQEDMILRFGRGKMLAALVKKAFRDVPDAHAGNLQRGLDNFIADFLKKNPENDSRKLLKRQAWYVNAEQFFKFPNAELPPPDPNQNLTEAEIVDIHTNVKYELPVLLERAKKVSSASGKKSELAFFLRVPLASVSRWLSGEREPGGEITLRLLKWVEQQERQK